MNLFSHTLSDNNRRFDFVRHFCIFSYFFSSDGVSELNLCVFLICRMFTKEINNDRNIN